MDGVNGIRSSVRPFVWKNRKMKSRCLRFFFSALGISAASAAEFAEFAALVTSRSRHNSVMR